MTISRVESATFLGGGDAVFGSCYLTNLRLIYEESEWARTLKAAGSMVPTSGDFGIKNVAKGAYNLITANYVMEMGSSGKLHVVVRDGQIIIPLSDIRSMELSGSRFSSAGHSDDGAARWLTIKTGEGNTFIFEIYDRPPDKTGFMPGYESHIWKREIQKARKRFFGGR